MPKLLDLNAIAPAKKEVLLGEKTFTILPLTVGLFAVAQQYQNSDIEAKSPVEQLEAGIQIVRKLIPSMTEEEIQTLPLESVQAIIVFAFNDGEEVNAQHAGEEAK